MPDLEELPSISQSAQEGMEEDQRSEDMEEVEQSTVTSASPNSGDTIDEDSTATPSGDTSSRSLNDDEIPTLCIPPKQTAFGSFEKLCKHLSQSDLIFDSFKELYRSSHLRRFADAN